MCNKTTLTGKPSIDRPWMKYYPPMLLQMIQQPSCTLTEYLIAHCPGMDVPAIHYYGEDILWSDIFAEADRIAKAMKALGFKEGDQIPVFLRLIPEFMTLLLAAEKIGASILCRDNTLEENVEAAVKANAKVIFAQDFLSQEEMEAFLSGGIEKIVLISPLTHGSRDSLPEHIQACLDSCYPEVCASGDAIISWEDFLKGGDHYTGEVAVPADINRVLYRCYTSGSTGPSKQVLHSAHTMLGVVCQMNFYGDNSDFRPTWLITCLPPALVAVIVSMVLLPMTSNKLLIIDPFVFPEDIDLEVMRYKPNIWPQIPMFYEILMNSKRIPKDYDMSHLKSSGAGCEAMNNTQMKRIQHYFESHNCSFTVTTGYGCSEAGSSATLPMAPKFMNNGNIGVPMPLDLISIFKPGTETELTYNQIGEICICGKGQMIGYDDEESTKKALRVHEDGRTWLHLGDMGYMDEDGNIYIVNRNPSPRYSGGFLDMLTMENILADHEIEGLADEFFVNVPDIEHKGYFLPYLYIVLEDGYTLQDVEQKIFDALESHMHPVEINVLPERPFWHFKTNRIGLTQEVLAKQAQERQEEEDIEEAV